LAFRRQIMPEVTKVTPFGGKSFTSEDLMEMDPQLLRALLRERTHHNIEVPFYTTILRWKGEPIPSFGLQAQMVFDAWRKRGLPEDAPDIQWAMDYLALAAKIRAGETIEWNKPVPTAFTDEEMAVVRKLIFGRCSFRDWLDKPVPDEMIEMVLEAGRAAPIGCNLDEVRFVVIKKPEEAKMIWSDISTKNAVIIVVCYDSRIPKVVWQDQCVPQNAGFDAAAAIDHMLLMAHALGLGGVWLSKTAKTNVTEDTGLKFKKEFGLPDYIEVAAHLAIGWPAIGTIKSKRMPLSEMVLTRQVQ
jgi:nitroreductase